MNTQICTMNTKKVIIYKGIEIIVLREGNKHSGHYVFSLHGKEYHNTNLQMAKRMINRDLN